MSLKRIGILAAAASVILLAIILALHLGQIYHNNLPFGLWLAA
jgi:hypothetical protein